MILDLLHVKSSYQIQKEPRGFVKNYLRNYFIFLRATGQ